MGTAKSDDESDVSSHPLAENRPGVYVQVVAPRRRKKNKRADSASSSRPPAGKARGGVREETDARVRARRQSDPRVAEYEETVPPASRPPHLSAPAGAADSDFSAPPTEAPTEFCSRAEPRASTMGRFDVPDVDVEPATEPGPTASAASGAQAHTSTGSAVEEEEEDNGRESGERPVDFDSLRAREGASDNTNQRPDLLGLSIPPPPRLPSFARGEEPSQERSSAAPALVHSASLLDAPPTLRPGALDSTPAERSSATLLAFVGVLTAIIVMAGLVALRELARPVLPTAPQTRAVVAAPAQPALGAASAPPALNAAPAQPAPSAAPASAQAEPAAAPAISAAPTAPVQVAPEATSTVAARSPVSLARGSARIDGATRPAGAKKAPGRALVAKANAALRQLANTGLKATPQAEPAELAEPAEPAAEEEERAPNPDEPLELPLNPY